MNSKRATNVDWGNNNLKKVISTGQPQRSSSQRIDSIGSTQGSTKSVSNVSKNLPEIVRDSPDKVHNPKTSATELNLSSSKKVLLFPKLPLAI